MHGLRPKLLIALVSVWWEKRSEAVSSIILLAQRPEAHCQPCRQYEDLMALRAALLIDASTRNSLSRCGLRSERARGHCYADHRQAEQQTMSISHVVRFHLGP